MDIHDGLQSATIASSREILFEYFQHTHADAGMPVPLEVDDLDDELRHECLQPAAVYRAPSMFVLAYDSGELIGCAGLRTIEPCTAELTRLYVRKAHRGGRGAELADYIIDQARESGASSIVLSVLSNRTHARKLYANLGFRELPTTAAGDDFVDMCMALPPRS
ncbi:GNAT family N-acetyltransferase [Nocardia macrotermitis]|uniref:N-acetyltransferase domain-containing protein n=1 Tax=Nocardia macrotermitis TaxID=2585198 RepID=A0A7K0D5U2_9NOCA|nr:GNAT family N-acetyltransferase [Nocardia macrotermitis]MQY20204.1 hypothetical protein [Nocardia macrotermitis]